MKQDEVKSLFILAGFKVLDMRALIDGYGYPPEDERYTQTPPRCVWWFVKTEIGWISIGPRKRVIQIEWRDTNVRKIITTDDVTKEDFLVHAYTSAKVLEYLTSLRNANIGPLEKDMI